MIPNTKERELHSAGVEGVAEFSISVEDSAHLMTILRDTLYSDKVLAVLREYGANAWDAHRTSGKADRPIKVVLPTAMEPTLVIRDFGPGLSQEDVFHVFTKYGKSTKRGTDDAVGMLGIGSKSGFAYSDSFTVTSWHGGRKQLYAAVIDASEKGQIQLLHSEDSTEESGLQIQIPVQQKDISEFDLKARRLFAHFRPLPEINTTLPNLSAGAKVLPSGRILLRTGVEQTEWTAVMGCIPYRINLDQIRPLGLVEAVTRGRLMGSVFFEIGEVQVSASREELKYTDGTKKLLVERMNQLVEEYTQECLKEVEDPSTQGWDRRMALARLRDIGLPVPAEKRELLRHIPVGGSDPERKFFFHHHKLASWSLPVGEDTQIVRLDDSRPLKGFHLRTNQVLVDKRTSTWEEAEEDLQAWLKENDIDGIPVKNLSSQHWDRPRGYRAPRPKDAKYQGKVFRFVPKSHYGKASENWEMVSRTPSPDDVFVVLEQFVPDAQNFWRIYESDSETARSLGLSMPEIYGYRSTPKKTVLRADLMGTHYDEWRKGFFAQCLTQEILAGIESLAWMEAWGNQMGWNHHGIREALQQLGAGNLVAEFVRKAEAGRNALSDVRNPLSSPTHRTKVETLRDLLYAGTPEAETMLAEIRTKYPLFWVEPLQSIRSQHWIDYIKKLDRLAELEAKERTHDPVQPDERLDLPGGERPVAHGSAGDAELPTPADRAA